MDGPDKYSQIILMETELTVSNIMNDRKHRVLIFKTVLHP